MSDEIAENVYVRLRDVRARLDGLEKLEDIEVFVLEDGYEQNEAGISELRDREGRTVNFDGSRFLNNG